MSAQVFNTFLIVIVLMVIEVMLMQSKPRDLPRKGEEKVILSKTNSIFASFTFSFPRFLVEA